jgi:30S ribosomal protein S31
MGKGDIRTRRGKVWRGTYGVTRPRRYKTVVRPTTATPKARTMKDIKQLVAEKAPSNVDAIVVGTEETTAKKPAVKKPAVKKATVKKVAEKKD